MKRYFCGLGLCLRPLLFSADSRLSATISSDRLEQWRASRATLQQNDLLRLRESLKTMDARLLQALQAEALANIGALPTTEAFPLLPAETSDFPNLIGQIHVEWNRLAQEIAPFEQAAKTRLLAALNMLRVPSVASRIANTQALRDEIHDLLHVFGKVSAAYPDLLELRREYSILQALLGAGSAPGSSFQYVALSDSAGRCSSLVGRIHAALGSAAYPFAGAAEQVTVVEYARAKEFDADPGRMAEHEARSHIEKLFALYYRRLARLAALASQVEAELDRMEAPP